MSPMLPPLPCRPCRPLTYNQPVTFTLNQDTNTYAYVRNNPATRIDPLGLASGQPCWEKEIKLTKVASCKAKVLSSSFACPGDVVADICGNLQKKITDDGFAMLYPAVCPKGETCKDMKPQSSIVMQSNQRLTIKACQRVGVGFLKKEVCCTLELEISGTFTGDGKIGCCG